MAKRKAPAKKPAGKRHPSSSVKQQAAAAPKVPDGLAADIGESGLMRSMMVRPATLPIAEPPDPDGVAAEFLDRRRAEAIGLTARFVRMLRQTAMAAQDRGDIGYAQWITERELPRWDRTDAQWLAKLDSREHFTQITSRVKEWLSDAQAGWSAGQKTPHTASKTLLAMVLDRTEAAGATGEFFRGLFDKDLRVRYEEWRASQVGEDAAGDGFAPPCSFVWKNKRKDDIGPKVWRLGVFLDKHLSATYQALIDDVWKGVDVADTTIASTISRLNRVFEESGCPWSASGKNRYAMLDRGK